MKKRTMQRVWMVVTALLLTGATIGCGDDVGPDGGPISQTNSEEGDAGEHDAGEADAVDGGDIGPGPDVDSGDADAPITDVCDGLVQLGMLQGDTSSGGAGDTAEGTQLLDPNCGADDKNEVVFEFSVDQPMRINASVQSQATDDWILALSRGNCDEMERIKCKSSSSDTFIAEPGATYYLAVEAGSGAADAAFSLQLQTTALSCTPIGSTRCEGDRVAHCELGFQESTYNCAYACDGGACGADICENALVVADNGTTNFSGSYIGYANNFNFQNRGDCSVTDTGVSTPGQDLVFSLTGLTQGQEVTIDASADAFQNTIVVMEGCSTEEPCIAGGLLVSEVLEWTAPADGDYHVVIDLLEEADGDFDFAITR